MSSEVCLFLDLSNVYVPAKAAAVEREGVFAGRDIRIEFHNLVVLGRAGRRVRRAVCVGSTSRELGPVIQKLCAAGVEVETYERGRLSGGEQGVDQCLQVHMLRAGLDYPRSVAVLLTGDGAGYESGTGFHADLERLHRLGWGVELISWDRACNPRLRSWAKQNGVYIDLESYYESCTFRQNGRWAAPVNLKHRPTATPQP